MMRVRLRPDVVRGSGASAAPRGRRPRRPRQRRAAASHGTRLTVLFGSNMGTAEELARSIAEAGEAQGFATTLAGLDDHAGKLPAEGAVAIVCASYNGGPPDNAGAFIKSLREAAPGSLKGVRYTVFGCGNRDWASTYQAIPRQIDELLAAKGAERIYVRGEGDAKEDLDGHFQAWNEPLLPALADKLGVKLEADTGAAQEPLYQVQAVDKPPVNPIIGGTGALPMRVLANRELQKPDSLGPQHAAYRGAVARRRQLPRRRSSQHRAAERRGAGRAGDPALRLRARRACHAGGGRGPARRSCRSARRSPSIACCRTSSSCSIRRRASRSRPWRSTRAAPSRGPSSRRFSTRRRFRAEILAKRKSVLDLLEEHPACELPFAAFLEMLPLMTPRYYSISSSPMADGTRCSVTVAVVEGPARWAPASIKVSAPTICAPGGRRHACRPS